MSDEYVPYFARMLPGEFEAEMKVIATERDTERRHGLADDLLCKVLNEQGFGDGVRVFLEMKKWYA